MGKCSTAKRQQIGDLNSGPLRPKHYVLSFPPASGWELSTEYPDPGAHQDGGCAALLPCGRTIHQLQ